MNFLNVNSQHKKHIRTAETLIKNFFIKIIMFAFLFPIGIILLKLGWTTVILSHFQNNQSGFFLIKTDTFPNLNETFSNINPFKNLTDVFKISFDNDNSTYECNLSTISVTQTIVIKNDSRSDINLNGTQFFIEGNNGVLKLINLNLSVTKNMNPIIDSIFNISNGGQIILLVLFIL